MTITVKMYAPAAGQVYNCKSGNSYTADAYQFISGVSPQDVNDLENSGCVSLGQAQVRNNLSATTNPASTDDSGEDYGIGSFWFNKSTGILYICSSATVSAATWNAQNVAGSAFAAEPWVTGRFYGLPEGATQAAVLTVAGELYAVPVFIPNQVNLDSISISVTTGQVGGLVRAALFADNGAGYPGAIVADTDTGDLDGTGTAVVGSSAVDVDLNPGWYWMGIIATATTTKPSVIGTTATYPNRNNTLLGSDTAAHSLATSGQVTTGIKKTGQTYPAVDMETSFPTFPAGAALIINASTPIAAIGV